MTTIRRRATLGATVVLLAACGGQHTATPVTASPGSSSPAAQSSDTAAAPAVRLPAQLLGHNENTSAAAKQAASIFDKELISPLTAGLGGRWTAGIYGGSDAQGAAGPATDFFVVVAGTLPRPIASADSFVRQLQDSLLAKGITDVKFLPAAANGEALVCGQEQSYIICSWADHSSAGYVIYSADVASGLNDGASKTRQIHSAVVG